MDKIYLISDAHGVWEDYRSDYILVYKTREEANLAVELIEEEMQKLHGLNRSYHSDKITRDEFEKSARAVCKVYPHERLDIMDDYLGHTIEVEPMLFSKI